MQTNSINVSILLTNGESVAYDDINYISFVSSPGGQGEGTYGIPALLGNDAAARAVKAEGLPVTILYVNPANIAVMEAERTA